MGLEAVFGTFDMCVNVVRKSTIYSLSQAIEYNRVPMHLYSRDA